MSTEAYLGITAQTLWEESKMDHRSLDELIEDARAILDQIASRAFTPLHSEQICWSHCQISFEDSGEPRKRQSFIPDESGLKPTNHGRSWTEDQIEQAKAFKVAGWSYSKIAKHLGRNTNGVRKMLRRK